MIALTNSCHEEIKSGHNIDRLEEYVYVYKHIYNELKYQYIRSDN